MSIESLSSSALRSLDVSRNSRDKARDVKPIQPSNDSGHSSSVSVIRRGGDESFKKAETFRQQSQSDNSSSLKEKTAIEAYQSIAKEDKRQNIQLLLGVDTFV